MNEKLNAVSGAHAEEEVDFRFCHHPMYTCRGRYCKTINLIYDFPNPIDFLGTTKRAFVFRPSFFTKKQRPPLDLPGKIL